MDKTSITMYIPKGFFVNWLDMIKADPLRFFDRDFIDTYQEIFTKGLSDDLVNSFFDNLRYNFSEFADVKVDFVCTDDTFEIKQNDASDSDMIKFNEAIDNIIDSLSKKLGGYTNIGGVIQYYFMQFIKVYYSNND